MYQLWSKARLYKTRPSDLINLQALCEEITGLPAPDELTAWNFDNAIELLGSHIDGKLHLMDASGKPIYQLEDLLLDQGGRRQISQNKANSIMGLVGGLTVGLETLLKDEAYLEQVRSGKVQSPPGWEEIERKVV